MIEYNPLNILKDSTVLTPNEAAKLLIMNGLNDVMVTLAKGDSDIIDCSKLTDLERRQIATHLSKHYCAIFTKLGITKIYTKIEKDK